MLAFLLDINNMVYFIFDFSVLSDFHWARSNSCFVLLAVLCMVEHERYLLPGECALFLVDAI